MTDEPNWIGISEYLAELAGSVGVTTYQSHKSTLLAYERWCASKGITPRESQPAQAASFLKFRHTDRDYSLETAYGHLCTLSNFHAATKRTDPELEKIRIVTRLDVSTSLFGKALRQRICDQFSAATSPNGTPDKTIRRLIAHLRQRCYGTRTHVVTEILLDTKGRINPVQNLDVDDLNQETGTVEIAVPEQFLVTKTNLLSTRTANLSQDTLGAIRTYLTYEREDTPNLDSNPLFTTYQGRASTSTLQRAIQRESDTALSSQSDRLEHPDLDDRRGQTDTDESVSLSDVRWLAIKSWVECK